ncbi:hypothetical protein [Haloflavibacter putidus]|uniref:hypothetical protein n=1 Tax=Haloflavibacter putidus TaxID=2576776 RepID=UPI001F304C5E|nr:hypothetical protein [Haloflavibacter putidus]
MSQSKKLLLYFIIIFLVGLVTVMVFINLSLDNTIPTEVTRQTPSASVSYTS